MTDTPHIKNSPLHRTFSDKDCYGRRSIQSASPDILRLLINASKDPCLTLLPDIQSTPSACSTLPTLAPTDENGARPLSIIVGDANPVARKMLGWTLSELKSMNNEAIRAFIGGRDAEGKEATSVLKWIESTMRELLRCIEAAVELKCIEKLIHLKTKSGDRIPANIEFHPIRYEYPRHCADRSITHGFLLWINPVSPLTSLPDHPNTRRASSTLLIEQSLFEHELRLQKVYQGACAAIGQDFFKKVLEHMGNWAGMFYSWVSTAVPGCEETESKEGEAPSKRMKVMGFWQHDKGLMPEFCGTFYNAYDTPCYLNITDSVASIPDRVQELFPDNPFFKVLNPVPTSWIGMAIIDTETGEFLGNLGMMDTESGLQGVIGSTEHIKLGLRVFAERAGAELKRLRMEDALNTAREEAIKANEAKTSFLSHMNHEIRTPMNAVIGMTELLDDTALSDAQRDLVHTLRSSGAHLLSVINDVLDLTKIELGNVTLASEKVDIRRLLEDVVKMVRPSDLGIEMLKNRSGSLTIKPGVSACTSSSTVDSAGDGEDGQRFSTISTNTRKRVNIEWEIGLDIPPSIIADRGRLSQILINLLANGYKFTDSGEVIARCVLPSEGLKAENGDLTLQFEVEDTGPGIPPDKVNDMFKPFVQLESTSTKHAQGSGLGLTIALHLVNLMHGKLWVKSTSPSGTTIAFTIRTRSAPLPLPPSRTSPIDSVPPPRHSTSAIQWDRTLATRLPLKILLAEDDMLNARIFKTMLGKFGYGPTQVVHVEDGVEVLRVVKEAAGEGWMFDVLFCDIFMPGMDGYTTTTQLLSYGASPTFPPHLRPPRIVALTANASVEDRNKCLGLGMSAYLTKPLTIQELFSALIESGRALGMEVEQ